MFFEFVMAPKRPAALCRRPLLNSNVRFRESLWQPENACGLRPKCYHFPVNSKQRRTLEAVWADPVNGSIEWARIESLLISLGCRVVEGPGSSVTFEWQGRRATFHRPHPGKEALRYRVKAARELLERMGIKS